MSLFSVTVTDLIKTGQNDFDSLSDETKTKLFIAFANEVSPLEIQRFLSTADKVSESFKKFLNQLYYCQSNPHEKIAFEFVGQLLGEMYESYLPEIASKFDNCKYLLDIESGKQYGGTA